MTRGRLDELPVVGRCRVCGKPIAREPEQRGRPRLYCSAACRAKGRQLPMETAAVRRKSGGNDFAAVLREGVSRHGHSLRVLARLVEERGGQISAAGLGAWLNGTSTPADPVESSTLRALELVLGLQLGDLALAFPVSEEATMRTSERRLPDRPEPLTRYAGGGSTDLDDLLEAAARLQEAVLAVTGSQRVIVTSLRSHYHIGVDRLPVRSETTLTVRAMHDLVDCYWFLHAFTGTGSTSVEAVAGCERRRCLSELRDLNAVELVFQPLSRGQLHTFTFAVNYHYGDDPAAVDEPPFFARAIPNPIRAAELRVSFDVPPTRLYECRWALGHIQPADPVAERELGPDSAVSVELREPRPGAYGWRWLWSDPAREVR